MSKKGENKHLKRLNAPKVRKGHRKGKRWSLSSSPGPHSARESIPIAVSLRENLQIAQTLKEARKILVQGEVLVDGKIRKDPKHPVGVMDVVEVPKTGNRWRVLYDKKGYLKFYKINEEEPLFKLVKVVGKHPFKGGRSQLSFHDGGTMVGEWDDIGLGDTIKLSLPEYSLQKHIPCEEGSLAYVVGGTNVGRKGVIKEIIEVEGPSSNRFVIESDGEVFETPEQYVFVVGKKDFEVSLAEGDGG